MIKPQVQQKIFQPSLQDLDLPLIAKQILIASYLASHNPAKLDKRFFSQLSTGGSKLIPSEKKVKLSKFFLLNLARYLNYFLVQGHFHWIECLPFMGVFLMYHWIIILNYTHR